MRYRTALVATLGVAVVGALVASTLWLSGDEETPASTPVLEEAVVSTADLGGTERLDATVESTETRVVTHRNAESASSEGGGSWVELTFAEAGVQSLVAESVGLVRVATLLTAQDLPPCGGVTAPTTTTTTVTTTTSTTTTTTTTPPTTIVATTTTEPCPAEPPVTTTVPPVTPTTVPPSTEPSPTPSSPPDATPTPATDPPAATTTAPTDPSVGGERPGATPNAPTGVGGAPAAGADVATTTEPELTITSLAALGDTVGSGDVLYTADGAPVVALTGAVPAWRNLASGIDRGLDVLQLEAGLTALGYATDLDVDGVYDATTADAVEAFQAGVGLEVTGEVDLGTVVFVPEGAVVTEHTVTVGQRIVTADAVLTVTAPSVQLVVQGDKELLDIAAAGTTVTIDDGDDDVEGTVVELRSAAGDGEPIVEAVVVPLAPLSSVAGTTTTVTVEVPGPAGVLVVPSEAIAARIDGTYAVQVPGPGGSPTWQTVEIVAVDGNRTAIAGQGIDEGSVVLVPA